MQAAFENGAAMDGSATFGSAEALGGNATLDGSPSRNPLLDGSRPDSSRHSQSIGDAEDQSSVGPDVGEQSQSSVFALSAAQQQSAASHRDSGAHQTSASSHRGSDPRSTTAGGLSASGQNQAQSKDPFDTPANPSGHSKSGAQDESSRTLEEASISHMAGRNTQGRASRSSPSSSSPTPGAAGGKSHNTSASSQHGVHASDHASTENDADSQQLQMHAVPSHTASGDGGDSAYSRLERVGMSNAVAGEGPQQSASLLMQSVPHGDGSSRGHGHDSRAGGDAQLDLR